MSHLCTIILWEAAMVKCMIQGIRNAWGRASFVESLLCGRYCNIYFMRFLIAITEEKIVDPIL